MFGLVLKGCMYQKKIKKFIATRWHTYYLKMNLWFSCNRSLVCAKTRKNKKAEPKKGERKLPFPEDGADAESGRRGDQAPQDLHDRGGRVHRVAPVGEADVRDGSQRAGRRHLERPDQPLVAGGAEVERPHRVSQDQHQERVVEGLVEASDLVRAASARIAPSCQLAMSP